MREHVQISPSDKHRRQDQLPRILSLRVEAAAHQAVPRQVFPFP
jgi:hypothetical protein